MPRLPLDAILNLVAALTVTSWSPDGWQVFWKNDPLPFVGMQNDTLGAYLEMNITNFLSKGVDDYRQEYVEASDSLESVFYGLRIFTLSIDCRSFAPNVPAWDILETIRLQVNNPRSVTTNKTLAPNGLSWIRTHPIQTLPAEAQDVDNRTVWRAVLDIEMSWLAAAQVVDDPGAYVTTIGESEIDAPAGSNDVPGVISNPDGNPWPTP